MRNKIVIFHFLPIEIFPPTMNMVDYLSKYGQGLSVTLVTTYPRKDLELYHNKSVNIVRFNNIEASSSSVLKMFQYLNIYLGTLYYLLKRRPSVVFYFETLSSLSPLIYKRLFKKVKLYIHYHEIVTVSELKTGRTLNNLLNKLEQKYYDKADWISQTNSKRMEIFLQQYHLDFNLKQHKYLPNYPSKEWLANKEEKHLEDHETRKDVTRLVHIGALSFEGMYLNDVLEAFGNHKKFELYFYSHTTNKVVIDKIESFKNVYFKGSIYYNDIPKLKNKYDIGLVLYKGDSINVRYCAPNKIFEYLALDLDVWCSDKLITAFDYVIEGTYPKMLMVDFENLPLEEINTLFNRESLEYKSTPYYCEAVYKPLLDRMYSDIKT